MDKLSIYKDKKENRNIVKVILNVTRFLKIVFNKMEIDYKKVSFETIYNFKEKTIVIKFKEVKK